MVNVVVARRNTDSARSPNVRGTVVRLCRSAMASIIHAASFGTSMAGGTSVSRAPSNLALGDFAIFPSNVASDEGTGPRDKLKNPSQIHCSLLSNYRHPGEKLSIDFHQHITPFNFQRG